MKHKLPITLIILGMFLLTQFIGLFVISTYTSNELPFGLQTTEDEQPEFYSLIIAFAFAFAVILILMKYKWKFIMRTWFFIVVILALGISINAFLKYTTLLNTTLISLIIAIPLSYIKIFRPNFYIHNFTEILIYPGIATVFVGILTPITAIILLILISIYDAWAVWKSGIMQKMAKFQMEELKIFGGFLIPSASKKVKNQIAKIKQKYKNKKIPDKIKKKKFKINLAILGGGDVVFPIITAGVFLRAFGLIPALFITTGAFVGLTILQLMTKKGKAYPAMPYITTGIIIAIILAKLLVI